MIHPIKSIILNAIFGWVIGYYCSILTPVMEYWKNNPGDVEWSSLRGYKLGFAVSSLFYGAIFGNLTCSAMSRWFGPRTAIFWGSVVLTVASGWTVGSRNYWDFVISRALSGAGIGLCGPAVSNWVSEMSFPRHRGFVQSSLQLSIAIGGLCTAIAGYLLQEMVTHYLGWRYMLAMGPPSGALLACYTAFVLPESGVYLQKLKLSDVSSGVVANGYAAIESERSSINSTEETSLVTKSQPDVSQQWRTRKLLFEIGCTVTLSVLNQYSGITALSTYAPTMFAEVGIKKPLRVTILTGAWGIISCAIATLIMERFARRKLYFVTSSVTLLALGSLSIIYLFFAHSTSKALVPFMLGSVLIYSLCYNIGPASMYGVLLAEVLSPATRAAALGYVGAGLWLLAALSTTIFPPLFALLKAGGMFTFYLGLSLPAIVYLYFALPETRGIHIAVV